MQIWDHETETGHESPAKLSLSEGGIPTLTATGPTPADAICAALCLLENANERVGDRSTMAQAISAAAEVLNDALIFEADCG